MLPDLFGDSLVKHWALHLWHTATLVGTRTDLNRLIMSLSLSPLPASTFWHAMLLTTLDVRFMVTLVALVVSASVLGVEVRSESLMPPTFGKLTTDDCLNVVETDRDIWSSASSSATAILSKLGQDLEFLLLQNFSWARKDSTSFDILLNLIRFTLLMNLATDSAVWNWGGTGFLVMSETSWSSVSTAI